jgi:cytochrome c-type biogenesis protein CcmF
MNTSQLGSVLVLASLLFASVGAVQGFVAGYRRSLDGWFYARLAAFGFSGSMIAANILMISALVRHDFSVAYVAEVGSRATPTYYTVISLWASLNGSILFWGGILGIYVLAFTAINGGKHREYTPYALGVLLSVCVFFALLVASVANPFEAMSPVPADGPGPNPLLQNHWLMAFHPPALYTGYVGMAVPFSMCAAALLAGRLEAGWMVPLRRWFLFPWMFLTIGIAMGGWWSYAVLGWGGYWAWDPVENASFMPWLTGTAFLHSAMVMERRGQLKNWTLILGLTTFILTLLGTFMTRSGVFNSVHSFTQSDIGPAFLVFIGIVLVSSVVLLAFRVGVIQDDPAPEVVGRIEARGGDLQVRTLSPFRAASTSLLSREMTILLQNMAFGVFSFTVLTGVLYPLITEYLYERKVSVGTPYFNDVALPAGILIVFLMGVGPAIPWGGQRPELFVRRFAVPLGLQVLLIPSLWAAGIHNGLVLLALGVCAFALVANVGELVTPVAARVSSKRESPIGATAAVLARSRRRFGGWLAHVGIVVAVSAIAMSQAYKVERDFVLTAGETATIGPWTATYTGAKDVTEPQRDATVASFAIGRNGSDMGIQEPRLNYYKRMREPVGTPAVLSTISGDFYLSLMQVADDRSTASVRLMTMPLVPWLWVSPLIIACGTLLAIWPQRPARAVEAPADALPAGAIIP